MNFKEQLIHAYDKDAQRRDEAEGKREMWKEEVRQKFADLLEKQEKKSILELGAGAGHDSKFFSDKGFDVLATDLSPEMIKMCRKRGIPAEVADFYDLSPLHQTFDAVYSMNVLLHVPRADVGDVLRSISAVLHEGGIFFYGVYGGYDKEETITDKTKMGLPRFFSFLSDSSLLENVADQFDVLDFETRDIGSKQDVHFQALTLQKKNTIK